MVSTERNVSFYKMRYKFRRHPFVVHPEGNLYAIKQSVANKQNPTSAYQFFATQSG